MTLKKQNTQEINSPTSKLKQGTHTHQQSQQNKSKQQTLLMDIFQQECSQFLNKKTQASRTDMKTVSIFLLCPRNTP